MISKLTMSIFFNSAWIFPLFLWFTPLNELKHGFYRFSLGLAAIFWGIGSIILCFTQGTMAEASENLLLTGMYLIVLLGFTAWTWNRQKISFFVISAVCLTGSLISHVLHTNVIVLGGITHPASLLGAVCLTSVLFSMILGHWYLNVPDLKITWLQRSVFVLGLLLTARLTWDVFSFSTATELIYDGTPISAFNFLFMLDGIFLWIALFFGLAAPLVINFMTHRSLKIFSTQSATGLLYINIVLILMSEMIFKFYLFKYNLVL